ncbi:SDR family NAD(P)-dependent oxidoreductase [Mangrovibacterium lignilyticum]|uniref:SDR family NAD(P)-dependent oxidoreductase n=1 Tax=Mangrovibacterium lignilyticum TaxID=2668052 RepID=UPI0013D666F0|nr:SDR family oxidoreductase [Mangrovibacterium lignilyticum]
MDLLHKFYSLEGLTVVVTGASSGLGLDMAVCMAKLGAKVFALSRTGQSKVERMELLPEQIVHLSMDVSDELSVTNRINEIGNQHGIDVLVNNAGVSLRKKAEELTEKEWDKVHNVNSKGIFLCCKHAYPFLKKSTLPGRVINISSMASYMGFSEIIAYNSSKASVLGITRALATEWREDGILVNSVSPGWFPTLLSEQVMDDDRREKILRKIPMRRFGKPEELSAMICFLASPAATYINGQDFSVDGGALTYGY